MMRTDRFVKIGVTSSSILERVKAVQTGTPTPIYYVAYYVVKDRATAFALEKELHYKLDRRRTYGEWFFNLKDNASEITEVLLSYGLKKEDKKEINIQSKGYTYDEVERASVNIDKYLKMESGYRLAGLGSKIYSMRTVVRVKELEAKYQNAIKTLQGKIQSVGHSDGL